MPDAPFPCAAVPRRHLLRAALAAPVAGVAAGTVAGAAAAGQAATPVASPVATPGAETPPAGYDPTSHTFTIAVIPDTQYLLHAPSLVPEPLEAAIDWLLANRAARNIAMVVHLGDVTEEGAGAEFVPADAAFARLDGVLPYSVQTGNHDVDGDTDDQRGETPYLATFNPDRFARSATFAGASADGYNTAHVFTGAGRPWLLLALDWRVSAAGLVWAQGVIDAHPDLPVILSTHEFVEADDTGTAGLSEYGETLWDGLVARNDQVFLAINGHFWPTGRAVLTNDAGHDVHAHIANYQDRYFGGAGMIRLYTFDLARDVIDVETFSPWLLGKDPASRTPLEAETATLSGSNDRFSLEIPFAGRFAGFAPVVATSRPAVEVVIPGTAAYWRFDAEGLDAVPGTVPDGAVVRDLSGNGNDLSVARVGAGGPGALAWVADAHPSAPARASLRFDGGKAPDRGATLRTADGAPINAATFEGGYTIELFLQLPEPFEGDHAWMGVFSWEGRSGDAGKTTGYDPAEPTCSLNVSGERFLQYVVYPARQDADPTSWSHAIPVGRWQHVAVVNDGLRTLVFVEGSLIARNPTEASTGIQTMGRPFVIGATSFDLAYGQGFYGSIGDVRIVDRALDPSEFLTA